MAFNDDDILKFQEVFRSLPSYNAETDSVSATEIPELVKGMNWPRTEAQIKKYIENFQKFNDGVLLMSDYLSYLRVQHDPDLYLTTMVQACDLDNNGFISAEEFKFVLINLLTHDPTLSATTYDELLRQADTNKDGKISVAELEAWIQKKTKK
jgi:Ca2+-binding EF-hand superfamily protein